MTEMFVRVRHHDVPRWQIEIRFVDIAGFGKVVALHRTHDDAKAVLYGKECDDFGAVVQHVIDDGVEKLISRIILYTYANAFVIRDINNRS